MGNPRLPDGSAQQNRLVENDTALPSSSKSFHYSFHWSL